MWIAEMRKDCPMRGNLGNCSPVGGFCMDAVSDEICEAVHNAYEHGFYNAVRTLKEQEPKAVIITHQNEYCKDGNCPSCGHELDDNMHPKYCGYCGQEVKWE